MFETKRKLKEQLNDAEIRGLSHFKKLFQIEQIVKEADEKKELYVNTVEKIKKVL